VTGRVEIVSTSPEETYAAGERLGHALGPGAVVGLTGDLGAGKTCFIQGLVHGLGVPRRATSPTFVLVNEYRGRVAVHHVDLYRVQSVAEAADLGLEEMFAGDGVTVVEWADRLGPLLPADAVRVHVDGVGDEPRRITVEGAPSSAPRS
jgi:tRNA threonylcarbamoyladenosine biosynthesis protein TsaE